MRLPRRVVGAAAACGWLVGLAGVAGCATSAPLASVGGASPQPRCSAPATSGSLVVYSATYAQTLEQFEYPAHTNYTVATTRDEVLERVANNTGSFGAYPAAVTLPCGNYHVRAQYGRGRFVVVPIAIHAGKTTVLDLDGEPLSPEVARTKEAIRLPDGEIAGWRATIG